MQSYLPLLFGLVGVLVGAAINYALNVRLRRHDRRTGWYDATDRKLAELDQRISMQEWKTGAWWKLVEEHMTDFLRPPR